MRLYNSNLAPSPRRVRILTVADITGLVALDFTRSARIAIPEELARLKRWREAPAARPSAKA
jgi:glutathione S-transferase